MLYRYRLVVLTAVSAALGAIAIVLLQDADPALGGLVIAVLACGTGAAIPFVDEIPRRR